MKTKKKAKIFSDLFISEHLDKLSGGLKPSSLAIIKTLLKLANHMSGSLAMRLMHYKLTRISPNKERNDVFFRILYESSRRTKGNLHIPILHLISKLTSTDRGYLYTEIIKNSIFSNNPYEQEKSIAIMAGIADIMGEKFVGHYCKNTIVGMNESSLYRLCSYKYEGSLRMHITLIDRYSTMADVYIQYISTVLNNKSHVDYKLFTEDHGRRRSMPPSDFFCLLSAHLLRKSHSAEFALLLRKKLGYFCGQYTHLLIAEINKIVGQETPEKTAHYFFTPNAFSFYLQNIAYADIYDVMTGSPSSTIKSFCLETIAANPSSRDNLFNYYKDTIS